MKIESLSDEQISKFPEYVKKWTDIGLCTDPANKELAEKAIFDMYNQAGFEEPKIIWTSSPLGNGLCKAMLEKISEDIKNEESVRESVGNAVVDSVLESVGNAVVDSVLESVANAVVDSVRNSVRESVSLPVEQSIENFVENFVSESVSESVWNSVWNPVWNSGRNSVSSSVADSLEDCVGDSVGESVHNPVYNYFSGSVKDSINAAVSNSVWDSVRDYVSEIIRQSICGDVWDSVKWALVDSFSHSIRSYFDASLWIPTLEFVKNSVWDSVWKSIYGQHDSHFLAFYDFFRNECNLTKETQQITSLIELAKHCGWCIPFKKVCIMSDRPSKINRDSNGRIHSETEAAIEYRDGWKIYAIHGVRLEEYIITNPEKITIELIENEGNVEVKRIMISRYKDGISSYVKDSGSILIDTQPDIHTGFPIKLWKKERKNDTAVVMVEMLNKTKELDDNGEWVHKSYYIRVKPDIQDAIEAVAWHHNLSKDEYIKTERGT